VEIEETIFDRVTSLEEASGVIEDHKVLRALTR
jgi:hypothetical protein